MLISMMFFFRVPLKASHEKYFKFEWLQKYESIGCAQWLFWCYENIYKSF